MALFVNPDRKTCWSRVYGCPSSDGAGDGETWREEAIKRVALLAAFARNETWWQALNPTPPPGSELHPTSDEISTGSVHVMVCYEVLLYLCSLPQRSMCDGSSRFLRDLENTDANLFLSDVMLAAQSLAPALQYS